ncbi:NADH-quinone oxidoreductase subunit C [Pelosinus sp. UFO1]|uniref:NADH-quinone oxidoreductase subunit D-related protein n=1 Tax=Pelosinus sp. UFO1 TaxID=484770 RepID=UPI0004D11443|nr:NADH-quinone oxidoreductase subunit C [Pelosinus sp. UFO1]AIF52306.1 NADH-ubiquinone oxidoreductase chain 49kDa [Pelosinus sp. UFO1]
MEYQEVTATNLVKEARSICRTGEYGLTAMFANDERMIHGCFAIYCIFIGAGQIKAIKGVLNQGGKLEFPSLTPFFSTAAWFEREIHDLFGIQPTGHPDLRPLVLHENWPNGLYPMRKDFPANLHVSEAHKKYDMVGVEGEGVFEVPVGPIHAGIIEPGHFRFSQSGEQVVHLDAKLFFTHRGIEKSVEGLPIEMAAFSVERICGACSVSHALSYAQGIESIANIKIPEQAEVIRIVVTELERLYNHVGDIGNLCAGVGFAIGISNGSRLKEILMRLNEKITGNRFLRGMIIPGGVSMEVTPDLAWDIRNTLEELTGEFKDLIGLLKDNSAFLDRVENTGILTHKAGSDLGVVGVAARASGINIDMRRDYSYSLYNNLDFKVPVYSQGDVAARLWVRKEEVEQSIEIIKQVLDYMPNIPKGLNVSLPRITPYSSGMGWSESARGSNFHWIMIGENNTIYRHFIRSASYPNWPAVAIAAPGNIIPDFPLINKSFELCYACLDR